MKYFILVSVGIICFLYCFTTLLARPIVSIKVLGGEARASSVMILYSNHMFVSAEFENVPNYITGGRFDKLINKKRTHLTNEQYCSTVKLINTFDEKIESAVIQNFASWNVIIIKIETAKSTISTDIFCQEDFIVELINDLAMYSRQLRQNE